MNAIVGREAELARLDAFISAVDAGAGLLVLEGEAGMGKTTLWRAGVDAARTAGVCVLSAEPAESETALSFSGLGDLLDPVLEEALEPLPAPQRAALARSLVLEEAEGDPPDARAVGVAVLSALRGLAADRPVLVCVDDVQWLDDASASALVYAARRLEDERVRLLVARRTGIDSRLVTELARAEGAHELWVEALGVAALHEVVRAHLEVSLPRPLLEEVHAATGGNPFFALELVRTLQRRGISVAAGQPLPVPESLHELVNDRLLALPPDTRDFLLAAAAHAHPTIAITEVASGVPSTALTPALDAHVVELDGGRIRFSHPLLAAGAYELANPLRRREVHRRLAEALADPEARAWQVAAAAEDADEAAAATLEDGAAHARARGAPRIAALLLERAADLTPDRAGPDARRRRVAAAYDHHAAGDTDRARQLLEPALTEAARGPERAALLVALARVRSYDDEVRSASTLYEQAIAEAEDGSSVQAYAQEGLAGTLFRLRERLAAAVESAAAAAATAHELGATQLEAEALATEAVAAAALGRPEAAETAGAALALQPACADRPLLRQPAFAATCVRFWHDDLLGAHAAYTSMVAAATQLGDHSSLPYTHVMLGQIDCALGRFGDALREAETGHALAEQTSQHALIAYTLAVRALALAHLGRADEATAVALEARELAQATSGVPAWIFATWALGHAALSRGEPAAAYSELAPVVEHHRREAIVEPGALPFLPDAIEALVEAGRLDEAQGLLEGYAAAAERLRRRRGRGAAHRSSGLLAGARGDVERAAEELEFSAQLFDSGDTPFERARSLLALGVAQRRLKRRREARHTLERALEIFEDTGAASWGARARVELKRISGRAATPGALTPAEERVAMLVAQGKTNKEVAAALFVSERTVEGHLARIFGKLGIRNRTEVASVLAPTQTQVAAPSNTRGGPVSAEPSAP